jgi:hypothetical protein
VQILGVQGDELGAPATAGKAQAEQRPVPAVARVLLSHGLDQGAQGVHQDWVLLATGARSMVAIVRSAQASEVRYRATVRGPAGIGASRWGAHQRENATKSVV